MKLFKMFKTIKVNVPLRIVLLVASVLSLFLVPLFGTPVAWHAFFICLAILVWGFEKFLEDRIKTARAEAEVKFKKQAENAVRDLWQHHDEQMAIVAKQCNETTLKMKELTDRVNSLQGMRAQAPGRN